MRSLSFTLCLGMVLLLVSASAAQQIGPTSLTAESSNNTSASSNFGVSVGIIDHRTADSNTSPALGSPIITNPFDITPRNTSKLDPGAPRGSVGDVHNLVYAGFNGKIFAETQSWFCSSANGQILRDYGPSNGWTFSTCNLHLLTGYESDTTAQSNAVVDDMFSRGFDGFIASSSGDPNGCGFPNFTSSCTPLFGSTNSVVDGAINLMRNRINSTYAGAMQYAVMEDQNAIQGDCGSLSASPDQPQCVEAKLLHDVGYYNNTRLYFSDPSYLTAGGLPVLLFFIDEFDAPFSFSQCTSGSPCTLLNSATCTVGSDCWSQIWNAVASQGVPLSLIFRNRGGFSHQQTSGSFAWVTPDASITTNPQITTVTQANWPFDFSHQAHDINVSPTNSNYLGDFYNAAECIYNGGCPGLSAFGVGYKGFDREDAGFVAPPNLGQVISQRCGQTWLQTFQKISGPDDQNSLMPYFSTANQLPFIMVATWDDYDEGTEIETGIDNCVDENSFSIGQPDHATALGWHFNFSDTTYGALPTINRYRLFFTTQSNGTGLFGLDVFPSCVSTNGSVSCTGINLNTLRVWQPGTYRIYIKALGQPSISNHMFGTQNQPPFFATFTPSVVTTSVSTLAFGTVTVNTSKTQTFTISVSGAFDVTASISINQSGSAFQLQSPATCTLTHQNPTCQVTVTYTPVSTSGDSASLVISHNGANGVNTVALTGTGASPGCGAPTVITGIDDKQGWSQTGGSATSSLRQNVGSPSLDGASAQFSLTGGPGYSYAKWLNMLGANDSASEFQLDLQAQLNLPNNPQMLQFGVSQILGGSIYAFHFACDFKDTGFWKVWNAAANSWSTTSLACTPQTFPAGTWVHLVFDAQRTTGNQLQYNWLSINGVQTPIGQTFNPNKDSPDNVRAAIILYANNSAAPYSLWIDAMKVTEICH